MKFEHIQLFMQVVEIGSISQAAKQGYITQQGLSFIAATKAWNSPTKAVNSMFAVSA